MWLFLIFGVKTISEFSFSIFLANKHFHQSVATLLSSLFPSISITGETNSIFLFVRIFVTYNDKTRDWKTKCKSFKLKKNVKNHPLYLITIKKMLHFTIFLRDYFALIFNFFWTWTFFRTTSRGVTKQSFGNMQQL